MLVFKLLLLVLSLTLIYSGIVNGMIKKRSPYLGIDGIKIKGNMAVVSGIFFVIMGILGIIASLKV